MKERYGAQNPESMRLKFSTGALGGGMTAAEPLNNIAGEPSSASPPFWPGPVP